jgi:hypothetical protein
MRRLTLSAVLAASLALAVLSMPAATMAASASQSRSPHIYGREVFTIVRVLGGPRHAPVTASGAFDASGYFVRKLASAVFPRGRVGIRRYVAGTSVSGPDLATCRFTITQTGTFRVTSATGRYRGIRESGQLTTVIRGRLKKTGHDRCGSTLVGYRSVTSETGFVR